MKSKENKEIVEASNTVKVKVLKRFRDKTNHAVFFEVGQELDFEKERAEDVVSRGLAENIEPENIEPEG